MKKLKFIAIIAIVSIFAFQGCKKDDSVSPFKSTAYLQLNDTMHILWANHMQWTYNTVFAFLQKPSALQPELARLLQNQTAIGNAFIPYYGQAAGDSLASLLTTHIKLAVPVLTAAQNGDQAALATAVNNWYANAQELGDYLNSLNPNYWSKTDMEGMWHTHITQTIQYSVDLLQGNYDNAVTDYEEAFNHMAIDMANMLSEGIAEQFPNKF